MRSFPQRRRSGFVAGRAWHDFGTGQDDIDLRGDSDFDPAEANAIAKLAARIHEGDSYAAGLLMTLSGPESRAVMTELRRLEELDRRQGLASEAERLAGEFVEGISSLAPLQADELETLRPTELEVSSDDESGDSRSQ